MIASSQESLAIQLGRMSHAQLRSVLSDRPEGARIWIENLARQDFAPAQVLYGSMLLEGNTLPCDRPAAFAWFQKAAAQKDPDGLNMLGRCLEHGWGCAPDDFAAAECFKSAADLGHSWALYNLGHRYLDGLGIQRNQALAYRCYQAAADQDHARAMNLVGRCLEHGWGVEADMAKAAAWYRRSAEEGYFRGQFNWASVLLAQGHPALATRWFALAYQSGNPGVRTAVLKVLERQSEDVRAEFFDRIDLEVDAC